MRQQGRIMAVLLCCAILLCTSAPLTVWALDVSEVSVKNIIDSDTGNSTALPDDGVLQGGTYQLDSDITLTTNLTVQTGAAVTIDLNGHMLTGSGDSAVITIESGGKLTIADSGPNAVHNGYLYCVDSDKGAYIWQSSDDCESEEHQLYGGVITRISTSVSSPGIRNNGGTLIQNGGTIAGFLSNEYGGAIEEKSGSSHIMTGGTICYNAVNLSSNNSYGGGVYFESNCTAPDSCFTMTGGTIDHNYSKYGGGVFVENYDGKEDVQDKLVIDGGTISDNSATVRGGGIYSSMGTVRVERGTVDENKMWESGSAANDIWSNNAHTYISGGKVGSFQTYPNNTGWGFKGNLYISGGEVDIVKLRSGDAEISGGTLRYIYINLGNLYFKGGTLDGRKGELGDNGIVVEGGCVYISGDYTTIANCSNKNGGAISVINGTVTMSGGVIRDNEASDNGGAICIDNSGASRAFTMSGGKIMNNKAGGSGGGIYISASSADVSMSIAHGETERPVISGNTAGQNGGGIALYAAGEHTAALDIGEENCICKIKDSDQDECYCPLITGNTAGTGGGLYMSNGKVTMNCGTIKENTLPGDKGANDVSQEGGEFNQNGGTIETEPTVSEGSTFTGPTDGSASSYVVTIPDNLTVGDEKGITITASLKDFGSDEGLEINITSSNNYQLKRTGGEESLSYTLSAYYITFTSASEKEDDLARANISARLSDGASSGCTGTYTDTLTFTVIHYGI